MLILHVPSKESIMKSYGKSKYNYPPYVVDRTFCKGSMMKVKFAEVLAYVVVDAREMKLTPPGASSGEMFKIE